MVDIASLAFKIDTSDVSKAESALDGLNSSGAKTEATAKGVGNAWGDAARRTGAASSQMGSTTTAVKQGSAALKEQQAELGKLLGQINPVVAALDRLDQQEEKLRQFRSKGLLDTESFTEYKSRIDQARISLSDVDGSIRRTGNTSKQTAQALRQLPAQFSDIFISLQAGQSPLTVFLQQGAQIKDSFGGAGPALAETARYALGLVNPFTVAAAAAVALGLAYKQGSDEATAFNTALILTGNIAGTSSERLANAASAIDQVTGTQRQAARALAEIAGTGKFTADQIETIGLAAVAMEEATGRAVSETVNEFKRLADEPAAAAVKLNEQYNFLTAAVYDQITALEAQGNAAGAAQLAIDTFAQTMNERAGEIENGLGFIERAWKGIKDAAAEAWDEMLGVGRSQTPEERLDELTSGNRFNFGRIAANAAVLGPIGGAKELFDQFTRTGSEQNEQIAEIWQEIQERDEKAWVEGMTAQQEQAAISAQQRIDQLRKSTLTNAEKRVKALNDLRADLAKIELVNPDDPRLAADNVARLERNIAEQFKDPRVARTPAVRDDAATKMLLTLRQQSAELESQLGSELKLTAEQKKRAEFEALIADLKTKSILTADQKSLLASQDAIKAQLDKNVALGEEVRLHNDSIKLQERSAQLQASIQASAEGRREQQQRNLDAFGQGRLAQEQAAGAANIFREFRRYQDQLNKNTPKDLLGSEQYQAARDQIGQGLRDALAEHEAYYKRLEQLQGSWQIGASQAFADFSDQARDIAGQTSQIISSTLDQVTKGIGDNTAQALIYGEDLRSSMQGLANDILSGVISSLVQMGAQYGINAALEIAGITAVTGAKTAAAATVATAEITAIGATTSAATAATATTTATQTAAAAATTTAWAPAATVASIGSFGSAAAIGLAAVLAAIALSKGFRQGGYTGNGGVNDVAGFVHGREFVFDADSVNRIGVENLEALRAGRSIAAESAGGSAGSGAASGTRQMTRGNFTLNQTNNFGAPDNRTPNQVATATNRRQRVAAARLGG